MTFGKPIALCFLTLTLWTAWAEATSEHGAYFSTGECSIQEDFELLNIPFNQAAPINGHLDSQAIVSGCLYAGPCSGNCTQFTQGPGIVIDGVTFRGGCALQLNGEGWPIGACFPTVVPLPSKTLTDVCGNLEIDFSNAVEDLSFKLHSWSPGALPVSISVYAADDITLLDSLTQVVSPGGQIVDIAEVSGIGRVALGGGAIVDDLSFCQGACGNGIVEPTEECDDGNVEDGDRCSSECKYECAPLGENTMEQETEIEFEVPWIPTDGQILKRISAESGEELRVLWTGTPRGGQIEYHYINPDGTEDRHIGSCLFEHGWNKLFYAGPAANDGKGSVQFFTRLRHENTDGGWDDARTRGVGVPKMIDGVEYIHDVCRDRTITKLYLGPYSSGCEIWGEHAISDPFGDFTKPLSGCDFKLYPAHTFSGLIICPTR